MQFLFLLGALSFLAEFTWLIIALEVLLTLVALIGILNSRRETTYKLAW